MSNSALAAGIRHLRNTLAQQGRHEDSDEQLLHAFTSRRDDNAFALLVRRHGSMVLHACRRVLGNEQDAEDAFQATFLVLARNASTLRIKRTLAGFLYGTAYRTALKAKQSAARRRKHEGQALSRPSVDPTDELSWREVRTLLDEEIARLPEIYRSAFVLCCLENLSQAEAGRQLGLRERTVSRRLAAARKRLAQRLARRGVELTAVLAAAALATTTVSAVPPLLATTTIKAALATTAGEGLAGVVSASVAALVENSSSILSFGKAKLLMLLLATSLLGGGSALVHFQRTAAERDAPPAEKAKPQPPAASAAKQDKENAVYAGRVLDPDGQPVAGAKLYLLYYTPKELPIPVRATSDKDGRFRFTVARKEFDQTSSARPWDEAVLVATAQGYGIGSPDFQRGKRILPSDWELRLCKDDVPITGQILDLQAKPIAGVSVSVHGVFWPRKEDLTAFLAGLKEKKEGYPALREHLNSLEGTWLGRDLGKIFPPVATGNDGRFTLRGVGRERVVALRSQGPTIAFAELFAMTRPNGTIRVAEWKLGDLLEMTFCGSTIEHIAAPSQIITGVIRDKDTGKPLPGAVVQSYKFAGPRALLVGQTQLRAVADKDGRYRLIGMPKGKGNAIRASGSNGQPYLMSVAEAPESFALEPVTVDFQLKRGVWVHGKVTEKPTGKPVHAVIRCAVHSENPYRSEARGLTFEDNFWNNADGSFRFVGLPGRSVVTAQTGAGESRYRTRVGADRIKDLNRFTLFQPFNTVVEINPDKDATEVRCDIALETGRSLNGTVVDPKGRPLAGANVAGLGQAFDWEKEPLRTAAFTVLALRPEETRTLQFAHVEKHLAGSIVIRGDTKGPLIVTLKPAGTLKGRFITPDGKPWSNLGMFADPYEPLANPGMLFTPNPAFGSFPQSLRTGKDGAFRVENLAPGLKYRFVLRKGMYALIPNGPAGTGVIVKEGETKDLGDVTVKPIE